MVMYAYQYIVVAVLHIVAVESQIPAVLIVNGQPGETATFECAYSNITSTESYEIKKDSVLIFDCVSVGFTCSKLSVDPDYSDVTFTDIGTTSGKGTFTVDNANLARDGGDWTCKYDSSSLSNSFTFLVTSTSTSTSTTVTPTATTISETEDEDGDDNVYFILVVIPITGLLIAFYIATRYKPLVISTLYVKVTKNTVQLSWKPEFEPVPDTTYCKCAPNGLTETADFIDGLFVVVFRELTPEKQHDVTMYCQNAVDMKLYKSDTCVVFTLKDSSNTHPKQSNPVLALHSLDLTVYQRKVGLSWTSPIAFDSIQVEYWVGSEKHITMSAKQTSLASSSAEMTRLLPEKVITFTITGEKDGTKYPSGILHQKTLKGLTDCCP